MIALGDEGSVAVILLMFRLIDGRSADSLGSIRGGWLDRSAVERLRGVVLPVGTSIVIGSPTPSLRFHGRSPQVLRPPLFATPAVGLESIGFLGRFRLVVLRAKNNCPTHAGRDPVLLLVSIMECRRM